MGLFKPFNNLNEANFSRKCRNCKVNIVGQAEKCYNSKTESLY